MKFRHILVKIKGYGTGLAEFREVFQAFYTTKEEDKVGLSICRSIVKHTEAAQEVNRLGSGTTFLFACLSVRG